MAIRYDETTRTLTLRAGDTAYQMQVSETGHLLHLYYGPRIEDDCVDHLFIPMDRSFSPSVYEHREDRLFSLDVSPQEYPGFNTGDYRLSALECVNGEGVVGVDLRYAGHEIRPGKYALPGLPASFAGAEGAETLSVTLRDEATGLEAELLYGVFGDTDVIARSALLRNGGQSALRLDKVSGLCLDLPFGPWELMHFHGRHCMERMPERVPLMRGIQTVASRRGASSHHHNPFVVLMEPSATETRGECVGVMPVYSGNHRTDIEVDQFGLTRVVSGINPELFSWRLEPGEAFAVPEVLLCRSDAGLGGLSAMCHDFIREHIVRSRWNRRRRPVLINDWEAMMFDFDEQRLLDFAREAKALGLEMMVLDDGWFGARNSDCAGLGDWEANPKKLPHGLRGLSDAIHAMGMGFGLWIEPEMVNVDSDLYRAHPDWALTVPGRPAAFGRNQLVLDMANPEVVDHLCERFSRVLAEAGVDYVKWDMNRNMTDVYSRALPADRQLEASHRYMLGVYDLMERLTSRFPEVLFEGCSGGGGRFDAGMLYYMPQIWLSDDSDAIERLAIQQGTSVGYPVSAMGAHVSVCPNQQTGRTTPFGTRAIVAMSGTFGYELDPAALTAEEKAQVREQVERFRRFYDLIQNGRYHRLTAAGEAGDYVAWQFSSRDGGAALLNLVVVHSRANPLVEHVRLRGLVPDGRYRLEEVHFEGCVPAQAGLSLDVEALKRRELTGAALMRAGVTLPPLQGDHPGIQLLFRRTDGAGEDS